MADLTCSSRPIGGTDRGRQLAAGAVLLAGAVLCAGTTLAGWPLFKTLVVLGGVVTTAWLVDGSSERYLGPGLAALAVGGGITFYKGADLAGKGEHGIVYPALGAALIIATFFQPMAARGIGAFLFIVASVVWIDTPWKSGWSLVGILAIWGAYELFRLTRHDAGAGPSDHAAGQPVEHRRPVTSPR